MKQIFFLVAASLLILSASKKETIRQIDSGYNPDVSIAKFINSTTVSNPYHQVKNIFMKEQPRMVWNG